MAETVFVLGAGFSSPAAIPTQNEIMKDIPSSLMGRNYYRNVVSLYQTLFGVDKQCLYKIPLEDVFSFLDRSILSREDTNKLEIEKIWRNEASLRKLIIMVFNDKLKKFAANKQFKLQREIYTSFFETLIGKRMESQKADHFSIVTLNWDTIPEYFINKISSDKKYDRVKVDYTIYDYGYEHSEHIPSIHLKVKDIYNIKIAKIHGSVNWGFCSSCGRLYVKYSGKSPPVFYENRDAVCKECTGTKLRRLIITPTFMKDLNNTHLRMIWHNALMDLQQAKRIVFVGYSFPLADFEFRYILTKAIAGSKTSLKDKKIRVILFPPDSQINTKTNVGKRLKWERDTQEKRYSDFFSQLSYEYKCMDALEFMQDPILIWDW